MLNSAQISVQSHRNTCEIALMSKGKLEHELRGALRRKQMSPRTEETYVQWYRRYVLWHGKRHPSEMGAMEVSMFDSHASSGASRPAGCLTAV